jgi:hypothetical protein
MREGILTTDGNGEGAEELSEEQDPAPIADSGLEAFDVVP